MASLGNSVRIYCRLKKNARILFSRIALKDIFAMLKTRDKDMIYLNH